MSILYRYIIHNLFEKKSRFLLLTLCLSICTGLFVSSFSITDAILNSTSDQYKERFNWKEYSVSKQSGDGLFSKSEIEPVGLTKLDYVLLASGEADVKNEPTVTFFGLEDKQLSGDKITISERTAKTLKLKKGSTVEVKLNGKPNNFTVSKINKNEGRFISDNDANFLIYINAASLAKKLELPSPQKFNMLYAITKKKTVDSDLFMKDFEEENPDFKIKMTYNTVLIESQVSQIKNYMYILLVIVVLISLIIIISTFKLITMERIPVLGTFISLGATKNNVLLILIGESFFYGVIGGTIGAILGGGIISLVNSMITGATFFEQFDAQLVIAYLPWGLLFSIILAIIASISPIIQVSKIPVKELILQVDSNDSGENRKIEISAIILAIISAVAHLFISGQYSIILLFTFVIGLILGLPLILEVIFYLFSKITKKINFISFLGSNTLMKSRILRKSMILIILSLLLTLLVTSATSSLKNIVREAYASLDYDFQIDLSSNAGYLTSETIFDEVEKMDEVEKDSMQRLMMIMGTIDNDKELSVVGIDEDKYLTYDKYLAWDSDQYKKIYNSFSNGDENLGIISSQAATALNIKKGDSINIDYSNHLMKIKVIGIIDGKLEYNSSFILVKNDYLSDSLDLSNPYQSMIFGEFKNKDIDVKKFKNNVRKMGVATMTYKESIDANDESNDTLMSLLNVFSFTALVIAGLGVFSNISISYMYRQKEGAIFTSLGLTKAQSFGKVFIESVLIIIVSFILSILIALPTFSIVSDITAYLGIAMNIQLNVKMLPIIFVLSCLIVWIAIWPVSIKNIKQDLVTNLKKGG